ncbi:MAG: hypothetical protein ACR2NP_12495 [Pirellulaceae bacterium]
MKRTSVILFLTLAIGVTMTLDQATGHQWPKQPRECGNAALDVLNGKYDPTSSRRPAAQPQLGTPPVQAAPPEVVGKTSLADRVRARIAELKGVTQDSIEPVDNLRDARKQIDLLKQRREDLMKKIEAEDQALVRDLDDRTGEMEENWSDVAAAVMDGERRSRKEWSVLLQELRDKAERSGELFGSDDGQVNWSAILDQYPGRPLEVAPGLQLPKDLRTSLALTELEQLKQAFASGERPRGMHPQDWIALQDRFNRDIAELQADLASAATELHRRHALQLQDIDRAIINAEEFFNLLDDGTDFTTDQGRDLAWRIHQARLMELEELDSRLAVQENDEVTVDNIRIDPLNPGTTIEDIGRRIHLAGRPAAPPAEQAQQISSEELPGRYPAQSQVNTDRQYERLLQEDIQRKQRELAQLNVANERVAADIEAADQARLTRYATELYRGDALLGEENNTEARNELIEKKRQQLAETRDQRIKKREKELADDIWLAEDSLQRSRKLLEEFNAEP